MLNLIIISHTLIWIAALFIYVRSSQASLFHPLSVFHLFYGIVFVLRPMEVHWLNFTTVLDVMRYALYDKDFINALLSADLTLIVFQTVMMRKISGWRPTDNRNMQISDTLRLSFRITFCILLPMAVIMTLLSAGDTGGVRDTTTGQYIQTSSTGYLLDAPVIVLSLLIINAIVGRMKLVATLPLIALITYLLVFASRRWSLIITGETVFLAYAYYISQKRAVYFMIFISVFAVFPVFYIKGRDREIFQRIIRHQMTATEAISSVLQQNTTLKDTFDGMDFAQYDTATLFISLTPEVTKHYTWFLQWTQLFTEPIPRIWWPSKPVGPPIKTSDVNVLDYANVMGFSMTMIGYGWVDLGYIGIIINSAVSAWIIGAIYCWFCRYSGNVVVTAAYFMLDAASIQYYRDGDISIFKFSLYLGLPFVVWYGIYRFQGGELRVRR